MNFLEIYKDQNLEIISENQIVFIKKMNEEVTIKDFEPLIKDFPRVKIKSFLELKKVFDSPMSDFVEIGVLLPEIDISISKDYMSANLLFHEDPRLTVTNEDELNDKITRVAKEMGIEYGLKRVLWTELEKKKHIIAEGKQPKEGTDAKITYFQNPIKKPKISEDGKADFSDMNFIYEIEKDDWLGEKIPCSSGEKGMDILGKEIPAKAGKDLVLKYNPKSVYESEENGKIIIRAKNRGVLDDANGMISILNHLNISTEIGVETGNVEFNGSITVKGTVLPGFSIRATGDISIEATDGVSGAKLIESTHGDVYIRGGVFGHAKTQIKAGGNVYVKHANEANIEAAEEICIETYSIGSNLRGRIVRLDEQKGKIIGGVVEAKSAIFTAVAGNSHERKTELIIQAIDQKEKMGEIQFKAAKIKELEKEVADLERKIVQLESLSIKMNQQQKEAFEDTKFQFEIKKSSIFQLNHEIQQNLKQLKEAGDEKIVVRNAAFEGTIIKIGKRSTMIKKKTNGTFKLEDGELNV